jgi:hypothetical protein
VPLHERLLELWAAPIHDPGAARAAFGKLYTDPVSINGENVPLSALPERATQTHESLERLRVEVLEVIETPGKLVLAFQLTARHVGVWHSATCQPLAEPSPSGRSTCSPCTTDLSPRSR